LVVFTIGIIRAPLIFRSALQTIYMAKKLTFDELPVAVEKILDILSNPDNSHTALPEILRRVAVIEKKVNSLQETLSPKHPTMDVQSVCRLLRIRPRVAYTLADSGAILSRIEGRKTLFYKDDVYRYFVETSTQSLQATAATSGSISDNKNDETGQISSQPKRRGRPPRNLNV